MGLAEFREVGKEELVLSDRVGGSVLRVKIGGEGLGRVRQKATVVIRYRYGLHAAFKQSWEKGFHALDLSPPQAGEITCALEISGW